MLASSGIQMDFDSKFPDLDAVEELLKTKEKWDFVVLDAWHLGRTKADWGKRSAAVPADFPKAMARFVKEVRAHSPECKIILFPWWIPGGPKATNEGAMEVFQSCVEASKLNRTWVATTGPAFMEARLERPDLHITKSKTDAHPGKEFPARVTLVNPVVDRSNGTFKVTLEVNDRDNLLRPGSFARARIRTGDFADALLIPRRAVVNEDGEDFVFVAHRDTVARVPVRIGATTGDTSQVLAGPSRGDSIVTVGQGGLKQGSRIKAIRL